MASDPTFYALLQRNARERPDKIAFISQVHVLSHREFFDRVDRLSSGLHSRGLGSGDRLCILAHNSIDYFTLYGACARIGATCVPINWRLSPSEITAYLERTEPHALVVDGATLESAETLELEPIPLRLIMEGEHPDFDALSTLTVAEGQELTPAEPETPFVILATAAVEGPPRGAVLSHNNLLTAGEQLVAALGLNPEDRHLAALPLYHVTGLGLALATLQAGGANVVMERFDPEPAARMMDQHRVTLMADFPPILATLLDARASSGAEWPDLRYVLGLDAPEVIQRLHAETGAQFWTGFGQSETSGVVTLGAVMEKPGSAGKPLPAAEVRCVDAHGEPVPTGTPGEIAVRGALVFQGYWRDPDASAYAARHGWHHTGDLGRFDEQGYLYYLGRKPEKDLIKSGGENIYPAEVEFAISSLPQVAAVCVIGVPDETWGESVKAVVELQAGADLSADQVIERVAERIASYKKPRTVVFVESLPRTPDGEIDRQAVKSTYT